MVDVVIIHSPDKTGAAERLSDGLANAGYAVRLEEVADLNGYAPADRGGGEAGVNLLIWSRPLVSSVVAEETLSAVRRLPNLIEVSADGISPTSGSDDGRVILISGWRGQPFHPGWQRLLAELRRLCGSRKEAPVPTTAPRAAASEAAAAAPAKARPRPARLGLVLAALLGLVAVAAAAIALTGRGTPEPKREPPPRASVEAPPATPTNLAPAPEGEPVAVEDVPAIPEAQPAPVIGGAAAGETVSRPPAPKASSAGPPKVARKPAVPAPTPVKRYSRRYSKTMRLFCQRSGRGTPQCRTFLRSMRASER